MCVSFFFATAWTVALQAPLSNPLGNITGVGCHFFSRGFPGPRDQTQVSCITGRLFTIWATREDLYGMYNFNLSDNTKLFFKVVASVSHEFDNTIWNVLILTSTWYSESSCQSDRSKKILPCSNMHFLDYWSVGTSFCIYVNTFLWIYSFAL